MSELTAHPAHPPSVDAVLRSKRLREARPAISHDVLVRIIRGVIAQTSADGTATRDFDWICEESLGRVSALTELGPSRVINATGTILHTNLGRAPLSLLARDAMIAASGYCDLEMDLNSGVRNSRNSHIESLLIGLLGCDAAFAVSNNAAAVLLAVRALAKGREVIVSRGQLVEIGDGFRLPSIVRESGARLVEVGTTNRTTVRDYEDAIGPRTAAILHVHPSNFIQKGFVESSTIRELATVARYHGVLLIADNGSGPLIDTAQFGLRHEPMPAEALSAGADVVTFSTDKLLGGPQGGIIAGRADTLKRISHHQYSRAIRPDKLIVAALAATLSQYARNDFESIPIVRMLGTAADEIENRATALFDGIGSTVTRVTVTATRSTLGGGALPEETLPSHALTLATGNVDTVARWLRTQVTPILGRTTKGRLMLDLRTVDPRDDQVLLDTLLKLPSVSW